MIGHADVDGVLLEDQPTLASNRAEQRAADRRRAAKLRERREQAGQVRIQAWVPRERVAYTRQLLQAAAGGANALPPDPGQQATLDAAKAEAATLRRELQEARAAGDQKAEQGRQAEAEALARAESARELAAAQVEVKTAQEHARVAQDAAAALREELDRIRGRRGWRNMLLRLAGI